MATTKKATTDNDVIGRLADKGEQAISRIGDLPGGARALKALNDLRLRVDEMGKRMRGVDVLENVAKLEKDVAALRRAQKPTSEKAPTRKAST
jgi:hypothetical protein